MKMNKKIIIPLFATAIGLSLVGGMSGAVAWYQFNSRVTTSFVGTSVADNGILQIGYKSNNTINWGRDVYETGSADNKLIPVTYGVTMDEDDALPNSAPYAYPEVGKGPYEKWSTATAGKEYIQYDVYLRALQPDSSEQSGYSQVSADVYLSDIVLESVTDGQEGLTDALRLHIAVDGGSSFFLSNGEVTDLELFGDLDLDNDGSPDVKGGYVFNDDKDDPVIYGDQDEQAVQSTMDIADLVCPRDANDAELVGTSSDKLICQTPTSGEQKITITVWLEGWQLLGQTPSAVWDPLETEGASINVGMTFDVGRNGFAA